MKLCTTGVLAFAASLTLPAQTNTYKISGPFTHDNLTVFLIHGPNKTDQRFLTLEEALDQRKVIVYETRDVNELAIENVSDEDVFIESGDIVKGGAQDRTLKDDLILPAKSGKLSISSFCVEHGRWTGESTKFGAAKMMVHPSVREKAAVEADQVQVWNAVNRGSTETVTVEAAPAGVAGGTVGRAAAAPPVLSSNRIDSAIATSAPTNSYRKIYQSPQIAKPVEEFVNEMSRRFARSTEGLKGEGVIGVIVAYGGEVAWSDAFASPALFHQYWSKLLRSYAVEALARPATKEEASLEDARTFLASAKGHEREESEPGVYIWRERTQGQYSEIELESLAPETLTLHWMKVLRTN